jgi:hypothetical protein
MCPRISQGFCDEGYERPTSDAPKGYLVDAVTNIEGQKSGFQINRALDELSRTIGKALFAAIALRNNYIIRPRSTSPGNFQAWIAVSDAPKGEGERRELRGADRRARRCIRGPSAI